MLYADDTSLLCPAAIEEQVRENFDHDQKLLLPWLKSNLLHLNTNKCTAVVYAYKTPRWTPSFTVATNQGDVNWVHQVWYLGLILDQKLIWKSHSVYLQGKLRKIELYFLSFKKILQQQTSMKIVFSSVGINSVMGLYIGAFQNTHNR